MVVVIDANVVISAALSPLKIISNLICANSTKVQFITPAFIFDEIKANEVKICLNNQTSLSDFKNNLQYLLPHIQIINDENVEDECFIKAFILTKAIDTKDTIYVALAISFEALLWTGDLKLLRALKRKGFNQAITKSDFEQILKGL